MSTLSRRDFAKQSWSSVSPLVLSSLMLSAWSPTAQAQSKPRIRVGQIGTKHGHASGKWEAVKKQSDHFELVGIVEADQTQKEKVQRTATYADCTWLTMERLLNEPGLQLGPGWHFIRVGRCLNWVAI